MTIEIGQSHIAGSLLLWWGGFLYFTNHKELGRLLMVLGSLILLLTAFEVLPAEFIPID